MPYPASHKLKMKRKILIAAKELFSEKGFENVTIDDLMNKADLTRGVFYTYFQSKKSLFLQTVRMGMVSPPQVSRLQDHGPDSMAMFEAMVKSYLGDEHLNSPYLECPLFSFPSDVSRNGREVQAAYQEVAISLAAQLESCLGPKNAKERSLGVLCTLVGAMVMSRAANEAEFSKTVRHACFEFVRDAVSNECVGN